MEFTENQMVFKVGWWIASYDDLFPPTWGKVVGRRGYRKR